MKV
ncbi:hypothetical protein YPPY72_1821, partial [Yersinia pestis PY-72]|jgi:hypothetical protein